MRITNKMLSNNFLRDMKTNLTNLKTLQEQMTSGKEVRRPSDNPFKVARAMQLHTEINTNKQYNDNIKDTLNWLDTTDTALSQAGDVLHRIRELLVSSGNGAYSEGERKAIKDEINEKISEFSQILNTNFDGKYIFGGTRATTKPMDVTGGSGFKGAVESGKIDIPAMTENGKLKENLEITFQFNLNGVNNKNKITINKGTAISSLSDLSKAINEQINNSSEDWLKGKIKVVPDIANNKLKFLNTNDNPAIKKEENIFKISSTEMGLTSAEVKFDDSVMSNTRIMYSKKGGGELVDGNELEQIGQNLKVEISQGVTVDYNVSAREIIEFQNTTGNSKDLRDVFKDIVNHLDGKNNDGTDADAESIKKLVNEDLQNITDAMNNVLKVRSQVGAKQNSMESAKDKNVDQNFNMTEILSKTEDIDITEKTMELATAITVYMASLQTSARVLQPTLIDYIR